MEELGAQKEEFELDVAKLRVAMGLRPTEKEVISWLATFRDGDPLNQSFRWKLVDFFQFRLCLRRPRDCLLQHPWRWTSILQIPLRNP